MNYEVVFFQKQIITDKTNDRKCEKEKEDGRYDYFFEGFQLNDGKPESQFIFLSSLMICPSSKKMILFT